MELRERIRQIEKKGIEKILLRKGNSFPYEQNLGTGAKIYIPYRARKFVIWINRSLPLNAGRKT